MTNIYFCCDVKICSTFIFCKYNLIIDVVSKVSSTFDNYYIFILKCFNCEFCVLNCIICRSIFTGFKILNLLRIKQFIKHKYKQTKNKESIDQLFGHTPLSLLFTQCMCGVVYLDHKSGAPVSCTCPCKSPYPSNHPLLCSDQDLMPTLNRAGTGRVLYRSNVQSARYRVVSFVVTCPQLLQSITSVVKYTKLRVSKRTILWAVIRLEVFTQRTWETPPSTSLHLKH